MAVSLWATKPLKEVIDAGTEIGTGNPYALQTSSATGRDYNVDLIQQAEKAGYKALIITVDAPTIGKRLNE